MKVLFVPERSLLRKESFAPRKRFWQFSPRTKSQTRLLLKLNSRQVEGGRREDNFAFDEIESWIVAVDNNVGFGLNSGQGNVF